MSWVICCGELRINAVDVGTNGPRTMVECHRARQHCVVFKRFYVREVPVGLR